MEVVNAAHITYLKAKGGNPELEVSNGKQVFRRLDTRSHRLCRTSCSHGSNPRAERENGRRTARNGADPRRHFAPCLQGHLLRLITNRRGLWALSAQSVPIAVLITQDGPAEITSGAVTEAVDRRGLDSRASKIFFPSGTSTARPESHTGLMSGHFNFVVGGNRAAFTAKLNTPCAGSANGDLPGQISLIAKMERSPCIL